jgi:parallel beta-helix repeat protein
VRFTGVSGASLTGFTIKNGRPYQNGTFSGNNTEAILQLLKQYGLDVNNISELNATMLNALMSYISQQSGQNNVSAGIYLTNANNCTIRGNIVEDSACGILLSSSENNSLTDNSLANNDYGIGVVATSLQHYVNYIGSSNTVNGKPLYYWVGKSNSTVPSDAGSVALINCTNITAQNLTLIGNYNGMLVINTKDSSIIGNTIIGNYEGLTIQNSSGNILRNNLISENNLNLNYGNNTLPNDIDASNMINGKPIYIWYKENDKTVPPDAGYVALIDCARITVQNLQLSNGQGILLQNTNNSKVIGNTLTNMDFGLFLSNSSNNIVSQNTVTASEDAIIVSYCSDITVSGNKVSDCKNNGIVILTSNSNRIESNMYTNNTKGLLIQDSSFNKISDNSFSSNNYALQFTATGPQSSSDFGVKNNNCTANSVTKNTFERNQYGVHYAMGTYNNNFCKNNFIENTQQVYTSYYSPRSSNVWDSRQEGNYWSNYNGTDTNHDGIGDQPMIIYGNQDPIRYPISSTNDQDHFPLMEPFTE